MKARNLNKVLAGLIFAGFAASSTVSTLAYASGNPWETGTGLTQQKIDSGKNTFNSYEKNEQLPKVSAYLSNWTHWEQGYVPSIDALSKYDTVILSFFGLCGTEVGDPTIVGAVNALKQYCADLGAQKFEIMTTDIGADLQKGFEGVAPNWEAKWLGSNYAGLMGVMKNLVDQTDTKVAVSIFGWSLSNIASDAVKEENRPVLINSLIEFITAYPFITQLDIDWEYPGIKGADLNEFDPINDAPNYAAFIAELRTALNANGRSDVKIGIASGAPKDKIDAAELQNLITAGVDTIHLMTYDFFGETWAEGLAHHTNLMANENSEWSSDTSIRYMIEELGINPQNIQIGYANYSRNAINANVETLSPLKGTFTKGSNVMGSFESAVTGINDTFTNYVEASAANGLTPKNGYHLYTDEQANADFLYHPESGIFMSLDTPRTVYAKGQYALKHNLGGIFTWMADQDEGLMVNAAREGLGYERSGGTIDMDKIVNTCGENVTSAERCEELTNLNDSGNEVTVNAGADVETEFTLGTSYALSGSVTNEDEIKKTVWVVKKANGIDKSDVLIAKKKKLDTTFTVDVADAPQQDVTVEFQLKATLNDDSVIKDKVVYTLKKQQPNIVPEIHGITYPTTYEMASGEALTFTADASDSEQNALTYAWMVSDSSYEIEFDDATNNPAAIDLTTLPNKPEYAFDVNLTVKNLYDRTDSETVRVTVKGDENANEAPVASFNVLTNEPAVNEAVLMESTSTDELPAELTLSWNVTHNGSSVEVRNEGSVNSFVPTAAGEYVIQLVATDVFGVTDSEQKTVTVAESSIDVDYVYPDGVGSYVDGTIVEFEGEGIYQCFGPWAVNCNDATYNPGGSNQDWIELQWKKLD
ncbi:glycosyl hydrolase family 18 protein [Vibrio sp. Of7-15]|uniref:glycosyl hydrolase family 18 protein n=1 Tax=Vibrio sp. Of7-15 TaxID=2724879 RepID=UPI001EF2576C|nr:glycosyl hydrolase family 18 protein [Vibrio sp. Of7-15]MCG7499782.1 glycosyl hydrolase family 18 protein [Vibrio sp. Of7-15]